MAQRFQGRNERLTRSGFKRRQEQQRRREEQRWASRSGPVKVRIADPSDPLLNLPPARLRRPVSPGG